MAERLRTLDIISGATPAHSEALSAGRALLAPGQSGGRRPLVATALVAAMVARQFKSGRELGA